MTAPDPTGSGPICPRCGGGPQVPTPLGMVCRSCAAVLGPVPPDLVLIDPDPRARRVPGLGRVVEPPIVGPPVTKPPADEPDTPHRE